MTGFIHAEQPGLVFPQGSDQCVSSRIQLGQLVVGGGDLLYGAGEQAADPVGHSYAALQRSAHQGEVEVVDVQLFGGEAFGPAVAETLRERVRILDFRTDVGPPPYDVMVNRKAG